MGGFVSSFANRQKSSAAPTSKVAASTPPPVIQSPIQAVTPPAAQPSDENSQRAAQIARQARGLGETIQTSYRGLLDERSDTAIPRRKNLLGE